MAFRNSPHPHPTPSYKQIHLKNFNSPNKIPPHDDQKSSEYFPPRTGKRTQNNYYLDSSRTNTSNKELSDSSRHLKKESSGNSSMGREQRSLVREVEKLRKELSRCEKMLLEKEERSMGIKKIEVELVETYRVIHYYEGKVQELQKICRNYEKQFNHPDPKKNKQPKISEIIEQFRRDNTELSAQLQQSNQEIISITAQLRQSEARNHSNQQKLIELTRKMGEITKPKLVDDYERTNLAGKVGPRDVFIKKRPALSTKKGVISGESDSEDSGAEYKNCVYISKKRSNFSKAKEGKQETGLANKQKSTSIGNINSRLNHIQKEMEGLKKENEKLQDELDTKVKELIKFKASNQELELKLSLITQVKSNEQVKDSTLVVNMPKGMLKEIAKPTQNKPQQNKLAFFVSNLTNSKASPPTSISRSETTLQSKAIEKQKQPKKSTYKFSEIKQRTIRKLILNVVREDTTYINLIDNIAKTWNSSNSNSFLEIFQDAPYQLNSAETAQFMFEYKLIMKYLSGKQRQSASKDLPESEYKKIVEEEMKHILRQNIPFFKNITIRRDFTLNIQLSNKFKNFEPEYQQIIRRYGDKMPYRDCEQQFLKQWGLNNEEFLFLILKNYEETGEIDEVHISTIGKYFLLD